MAIQAELRLGIRDFKANLDRATQEVRKSAGTMKQETSGIGAGLASGIKGMLPALGFTAVAAGIKSVLNHADDIADLSVKLNESAEALQRVDHAAQIAGAGGVDQIGNAIIRLEKNLGMVENSKAAAALEHFGLTGEKLMGLPIDQKILALSGAFQQAREDGTGVADLMDLVGKSGADLIPMLGLAREELEALFRDAPVMAEAEIVALAKMNDQVDTLWAKLKNFGAGAVAGSAGIGQFLGDLLSTGSLEEAQIRMVDRDTEATRGVYARKEQQEATAKATEAQRSAAEAASAEVKATDELAKSLAEIAKLKEDIARDKLDILPDDEKLAALQEKLKTMLGETVGNFSLNYETSTAGLAKLAQSREGNPSLPASGTNSAQEAYEWLAASLEIEKQIADLKEKAAKTEAELAEKRAADLATAREQAEAGGFTLLTPEQQAARLMEQLEGSLGIDVKGMKDVDAGLAKQRKAVEDARASGDTEAEKAALDKLSESQRLAKEFTTAASDLAPNAPDGGVGSLAGLVNQMFGRDPQAQQVEEIKKGNELTKQVKEGIDKVITKMDEQPPPIAFTRL